MSDKGQINMGMVDVLMVLRLGGLKEKCIDSGVEYFHLSKSD